MRISTASPVGWNRNPFVVSLIAWGSEQGTEWARVQNALNLKLRDLFARLTFITVWWRTSHVTFQASDFPIHWVCIRKATSLMGLSRWNNTAHLQGFCKRIGCMSMEGILLTNTVNRDNNWHSLKYIQVFWVFLKDSWCPGLLCLCNGFMM